MKNLLEKNNKLKIAIGVSGTGTTFEVIAREIKKGKLNLDLDFLFTDRDCEALNKSKKIGINTVQKKKNETIESFHERIINKILDKEVDLVILAGYLRLFPVKKSDPFLVINSHPGAIPYFGGKGMWGSHVHEAVINWAKDNNFLYPFTFSTVHIASDKYDEGPPLGIKKVRITKKDNAETLSRKLLPIEHQNYLEVLNKFSEKTIEYPKYPGDFLKYFKK